MKVKTPPTPTPPCPHCSQPQVRSHRGKLYCRPCSAKRMKGRVAAPKETAECERCGDEFLRSGSAKLRAVNCPRCRKSLAERGYVHEPDEEAIYAEAARLRLARDGGPSGGVLCLTDDEERRFRMAMVSEDDDEGEE